MFQDYEDFIYSGHDIAKSFAIETDLPVIKDALINLETDQPIPLRYRELRQTHTLGMLLLEILKHSLISKNLENLHWVIDELQNQVQKFNNAKCSKATDIELAEIMKEAQGTIYVGSGSRGCRLFIKFDRTTKTGAFHLNIENKGSGQKVLYACAFLFGKSIPDIVKAGGLLIEF